MLPVDLRTTDLLRFLSHSRHTADLLSIASLLLLTLSPSSCRKQRFGKCRLHLRQRGSASQRAHNDDAVRIPQLIQRVGAGHRHCAVLVLVSPQHTEHRLSVIDIIIITVIVFIIIIIIIIRQLLV